MRLLLFTLLILGFCLAAEMQLPAVGDGEIGSLITMEVSETQGNGGVYVSTKPLAGEDFQQSINDAIECVSQGGRDFSSSVVLVSSESDIQTSVLDGPSAGAALAAMLKSGREGRLIRTDTTITGGITPECDIIPVGGLAEKAEAADEYGIRSILVPETTPEETALLDRLHSERGISVHEYETFSEAYSLLTSGATPEHSLSYGNATFDASPLRVVVHNDVLVGPVGGMSLALNEQARRIPQRASAARDYYTNKSQLVQSLYEKGYTYSAGNEAFLSLLALSVLTSNFTDDEISAVELEVMDCLDRTSLALNASRLDVEHYSNAELRYYWAAKEVEALQEQPATFTNRMRKVQSLERAYLWCSLAEGISKESSGETNTTQLKDVAEALILNYSDSGQITENLATAAEAYDAGNYGAALVLVSMHESQLSAENTSNYTAAREWTQMLAHHSEYLSSSTDYGPDAGKGIMLMAMMLDRHYDEVELGAAPQLTLLLNETEGSPANNTGESNATNTTAAPDSLPAQDNDELNRHILLIFSLICILLAFAIAVRVLRAFRR